MRREGSLLARLARAAVPVPALIAEDEDLRLQVRSRVPGLVGHEIERLVFGTPSPPDSAHRYRPDCPLTVPGRRLAYELGTAIAKFHRAIPVTEVRKRGFEERQSENWERVASVLGSHAPDPDLLAALGHLRRWEAGLPRRRVLAHGDVHMFNVGVDVRTGILLGFFDFDSSCLAHPYEDLKFAFSNGYRFAERALRAYGEAAGEEVSLTLLTRFHVRAAFAHFEYVAPDSARFPQIIGWSRAAVRQLTPEWKA